MNAIYQFKLMLQRSYMLIFPLKLFLYDDFLAIFPLRLIMGEKKYSNHVMKKDVEGFFSLLHPNEKEAPPY